MTATALRPATAANTSSSTWRLSRWPAGTTPATMAKPMAKMTMATRTSMRVNARFSMGFSLEVHGGAVLRRKFHQHAAALGEQRVELGPVGVARQGGEVVRVGAHLDDVRAQEDDDGRCDGGDLLR